MSSLSLRGEGNLNQQLQGVLHKFSKNTSAHAPPKIVSHRSLLAKLFWSALFVAGIGLFIFFSQRLIVQYLKYESTTDIELKFDVLNFPAVSICNLNQFRKDRVKGELFNLYESLTQAKREDMFGGQQAFHNYFAQHPTEEPLYIPWWATTQYPSSPNDERPTTPSAERRKKRSVARIEAENQLKVLEDMQDLYRPPNISDVKSMDWFLGDGEMAAEKEIFLNVTQYVSSIANESLLSTYGHRIQEMLQECIFQGVTCGPDDFFEFYDKRYGNCYTFNSGMDKEKAQISSPGAEFGLSLILFLNQPMYMPVLSPQAGFRVVLHKQGETPLMLEEGFNVLPGVKSSIAVKYNEIQRLEGEDYSNCTQQSVRPTDGSLHAYYPGNYTQQGCIKTCVQKATIKECGCANALYRAPAGVLSCGVEQSACMEEVERNLLATTCRESCPLPCWESSYDYKISMSQWPSINYQPYLVQTLRARGKELQRVLDEKDQNRDGLAQEFVNIEIYFDNLNFYRYKETASMTFEDLVGALGGHLGLWIGMSMISFVEVFDLIASLFRVCCWTYRHSKNKLTDQYSGNVKSLETSP